MEEDTIDPIGFLNRPLPDDKPFIPFPENDVHPYSVRQFFAVHMEEHEQAERFEVAKYLWDQGLQLLRHDNPLCVQYFGDALTKYIRVLDPYDPTYLTKFAKIRTYVDQQLATGPPPYGSATDYALPRFRPNWSTDTTRFDLYPKPADTHFRELLAQDSMDTDETAEDLEIEEARRSEMYRDRERRRR
ncbi:hypothetical protein HK097_011550, partial [Rhizophlyctis rosea]